MRYHPDPSKAMAFLLDKVERERSSRANYYQAIELVHGVEAIAPLRRLFDEYRSLLATDPAQRVEIDAWIDYLQCCKTLFSLTEDEEFLLSLKQAAPRVPLELQMYTSNLLEEIKE
jgi:hypothetical protein